MRNWAFNIIINASKKNARRRERLFKYFDDIHVDNGIVRFASTSSPTRVYDIEAQAFTFIQHDRVVYEQIELDDDDEYEPIDWYS